MCGQLGWFIKKPVRQLPPMAAVMEVTMDVRGDDSWGFYGYPYKVDPKTKEGRIAYSSPVYKRGLGTLTENVPARSLRNFAMFLGHSRDASVGKVTIENSHPYIIGNIVGAHNGAISHWDDLNKKYSRKYEVDSQHIFAHIDEGRSLKDIQGYGSIVWINRELPHRVNLVRWNENSTLAIAELFFKTGEPLGVAWASTADDLASSVLVSGLEFKVRSCKEREPYLIEPDSKDGTPTLFVYKDKNMYDFGSKWSGGTYVAGQYERHFHSHVYCKECGVADEPQYHQKGGKHTPIGATKNLDAVSDGTKMDVDSRVILLSYKAYKVDDTKLQDTVCGKRYQLIEGADGLVRCLVKPLGISSPLALRDPKPEIVVPNAVTGQEVSVQSQGAACALCGGPGPYRKVGRWQLCNYRGGTPNSCYTQFNSMTKEAKRELIQGLVDEEQLAIQKRKAQQQSELQADMWHNYGFSD